VAKQSWVKGTPQFMAYFNGLDKKSQLWKDINEAIDALKLNPLKGDKIEKDRCQRSIGMSTISITFSDMLCVTVIA